MTEHEHPVWNGNGRRRLLRWSELRPLIGLRAPRWGSRARLEAAGSIEEVRRLARRRMPRAVFDYVDGAAEAEISLERMHAAFGRVEFRPRVLEDVSEVSMATTIMGEPASMPVVFAPTGFTRMMHPAGERAVAQAAAEAGIPYTLSTMATTTPESVAEAAPDGRHWFQLYVCRDRGVSNDLVARAAACGFGVLVLTVDTPVTGARLRDVRNGLTIPPSLSVRTLADMGRHPKWWLNLMTSEPLTFASLTSTDGSVADMADRLFEPSLTLADIEWIRGIWPGRLVVKGVQTVEDARRVVAAGVDGLVLSNHGGRQLDRAPTPLEELAPVVDAVGDDAEVMLDGGIKSGADVVAAVALGARACLVGRGYLYGLMVGGHTGVQRVAAILRTDIERTMKLVGVVNVQALGPEHARLRA